MTPATCTHSFPDPFPQPISQPGNCRGCGISYEEAKAEMTTPSDELRAASARLRELAKAIHAPDLQDQSWHVEECASEERGDCPCIIAQGVCNTDGPVVTPVYYVADAETPELAAYIVAMGPNVGITLADWLDTAAANAAVLTWPNDFIERALAVARQINTGSQP